MLKVKEIYSLIVEDKIKPTPQTFAAIIECLGRSPSVKAFKRNVAKTIDTLQKEVIVMTICHFDYYRMYPICPQCHYYRKSLVSGLHFG